MPKNTEMKVLLSESVRKATITFKYVPFKICSETIYNSNYESSQNIKIALRDTKYLNQWQ
jgi:hypothetical protein